LDHAQEWLELEAIKRLKARYFRCMDTKDWEGWADVFTEDAALEFDLAVSTLGRPGQPAPKLVGRPAILAYVSKAFATNQTVHHGHMPELELLSETRARGVWAMEDIVDDGHQIVHGYGHYHDTYRKVGGDWKIDSVRLTRIRLSQVIRDRMSPLL
jgi:hypothetical protein